MNDIIGFLRQVDLTLDIVTRAGIRHHSHKLNTQYLSENEIDLEYGTLTIQIKQRLFLVYSCSVIISSVTVI